MRTAVLQATTICVISMLYNHYDTQNMFNEVFQDEGWIGMVSAVNGSLVSASTGTQRGNWKLSVDSGDKSNTTLLLNQTTPLNSTIRPTTRSTGEPFLSRELPRNSIVSIVLLALQYWWFVGLERLLPARPRSKRVPTQQKEQVEENEDREEEVVKKWIAQGRVRRASLNWCNTFLKWVIAMTVGNLGLHIVGFTLRELLKFQSPSAVLQGLKRVSRPSAACSNKH